MVAVVGEASEMSGEAASRTDITLPESQKKLIRALVNTGKPVVLVMMSTAWTVVRMIPIERVKVVVVETCRRQVDDHMSLCAF